MTYTALLSERQDNWRSRPSNTVLRNPPHIWGEGEDGEPEGYVVEPDNLETALHAPDAIERFGFEVFDLIEPVRGSCLRQNLGRHVRFADQAYPVLLDDTQAFRIACCLERHGFTFRFAYPDEGEIDEEDNYRRFDKWLRTYPVREFDLTLLSSEGAAA